MEKSHFLAWIKIGNEIAASLDAKKWNDSTTYFGKSQIVSHVIYDSGWNMCFLWTLHICVQCLNFQNAASSSPHSQWHSTSNLNFVLRNSFILYQFEGFALMLVTGTENVSCMHVCRMYVCIQILALSPDERWD